MIELVAMLSAAAATLAPSVAALFEDACTRGQVELPISIARPIGFAVLPTPVKRAFGKRQTQIIEAQSTAGVAYLITSDPSFESGHTRSCSVIAQLPYLDGVAIMQPGGVIDPISLKMYTGARQYSFLSAEGYRKTVSRLGGGWLALSASTPELDSPSGRDLKRLKDKPIK